MDAVFVLVRRRNAFIRVCRSASEIQMGDSFKITCNESSFVPSSVRKLFLVVDAWIMCKNNTGRSEKSIASAENSYSVAQ